MVEVGGVKGILVVRKQLRHSAASESSIVHSHQSLLHITWVTVVELLSELKSMTEHGMTEEAN